MKRLRVSLGIIAVSIASVGCGDDNQLDTFSSSNIAAVDALTDDDGLTWLRVGDAKFDYRTDEELREALPKSASASEASDPDPEQFTDEEWGRMKEPITEFRGSEYRLSTESMRNYGKALRKNALDRKKNPGRPDGIASARSTTGNDLVANGLPVNIDKRDKGIRGTDDRMLVDGSRPYWPYNMHATMVSPTAVCTAFKVVNHHTAGTAAHCVHTGSGWKPRSDLTFSDGRLGTVPAGCYLRTVSGEWINNPGLPKNDYAVMALKKVSAGTWCNFATYNVGFFGYKSVGYTEKVAGFVSGYPGSGVMPPGVVGYPHLVFHWAEGAEVGFLQSRVLQYQNDATGGQSGTPFVSWTESDGFHVRAIHKGDVDRIVIVDYNQGREFDGNVADFFKSNGGDAQ